MSRFEIFIRVLRELDFPLLAADAHSGRNFAARSDRYDEAGPAFGGRRLYVPIIGGEGGGAYERCANRWFRLSAIDARSA